MKARYLGFAFCGVIAGSFVPGLAQDTPAAVSARKVPQFEAVHVMCHPISGGTGTFDAEVAELLKRRSAEGWEFVAVTSAPRNSNGTAHVIQYQYVFKRE